MGHKEKETLVAEAVVCRQDFANSSYTLIVILNLLVLAIILGLVAATLSFSKKIQLFPLKGRAPRLAILQMMSLIMLSALPLIVEGLVALEAWPDPQDRRPSLSKNVVKAFYALCRANVYGLYGARGLIIYANWKVKFEKLRSGFWSVFGNEMNLMIVNFVD